MAIKSLISLGPSGHRRGPQGVRAREGCLDAAFKISLTGLTTTPMATIVRKSELARELGVSRARISQFVAYGLPVRDDGFIDLEQAAQWVLDNIIDQWTDGASPAVRNAQEILWGSR
jgi:hypothetical protein